MSRELGCLHPDFLLDELSSAQLAEWEAYSQIEPIGSEWRADWRNALLCTVITNLFKSFSATKHSTPTWSTVDEFMPPWDDIIRQKRTVILKEQTTEEMKEAVLRIGRVMGTKKRELDNQRRPPRKKRGA